MKTLPLGSGPGLLAMVAASVMAGACSSGTMAGSQAPGQTASIPSDQPDLWAVCEGCDENRALQPARLPATARLAPQGEPGQPMLITGTIFYADGRTPAAAVTLYAYQTDARGIYRRSQSDPTEWGRHGPVSGWVMSDARGRYRFETIKPGEYPSRTEPAHVHMIVYEPGGRPHYINDLVFRGEHGVTPEYIRRERARSGSGIVTPSRASEGVVAATRNIVLDTPPPPSR